MGLERNRIVKFAIIYIAQVGTLWGLLEGYSYFQGNALKDFLGPFWVLIYILPILTSGYIVLCKGGNEGTNPENITPTQEIIETEGAFSPGKVGRDYSVRNSETTSPPTQSGEDNADTEPAETAEQARKIIRTKGDYSPGEVGGDYTVDV